MMIENERFKVKGFDEYDQVVWDTEFEQSCSVEQVVNMLNDKDWVIDACNEEIEELKQSNKYLQEELDKVFNLINRKIKKHEEAYSSAVRAGMPSSIIYDEIELLEELKKELEE